MAIARWEPFRELGRIQDEFNRLFDDRMFRWRQQGMADEEMGTGWYPPIDIYEDQEALTITAELPGIDPKDVDVRVENGVLTVRGERKLEHEDKKENYRRVERMYGSFMRSFTLPTVIDADKVRAEFKNGLLRVVLPRREDTKPKAIRVKVDG